MSNKNLSLFQGLLKATRYAGAISTINKNIDKKKKNIGELLADGELILKKSGNKSAAEESLLLLSYLLKREKFDIFLNRSLNVSFREIQLYYEWIDRRTRGTPVQYITGFQNFMGMEFKIAKGVFIPRPETEILVEELIKLIESMPNEVELSFLDIGVGSGIIPVSICQYFQKRYKNIHFYAIDISMKAIELAEENAKKFKCEDRITFFHGDLFFALKMLNSSILFDGIISNPPYISRDEMVRLPDEIYLHEPREALYGGEEGLDYYQKIICQSPEYLKKGKSFLALEIGHKQKGSVRKIINQTGFFKEKVSILSDYYQNDRAIVAFTRTCDKK